MNSEYLKFWTRAAGPFPSWRAELTFEEDTGIVARLALYEEPVDVIVECRRHELFSSLPLRRDTEYVTSWQQLELQQDRFWSSSSWQLHSHIALTVYSGMNDALGRSDQVAADLMRRCRVIDQVRCVRNRSVSTKLWGDSPMNNTILQR